MHLLVVLKPALPSVFCREDAAVEILESMTSMGVEVDSRCYRLAAEAFEVSTSGDFSKYEVDRLLRLAQDMQAVEERGENEEIKGKVGFEPTDVDLSYLLNEAM